MIHRGKVNLFFGMCFLYLGQSFGQGSIEDQLDAFEQDLQEKPAQTPSNPRPSLEKQAPQNPQARTQSEELNTLDLDELENLEEDIGPLDDPIEEQLSETPLPSPEQKAIPNDAPEEGPANESVTQTPMDANENPIFNPGQEEQRLLEIASKVGNRIPQDEWNEIALAAAKSSYTVQEGDWLWKISERLFGSGFYYPKIWALNPYITNPHEIEPGMTLIFTTGDADSLPEIQMGEFAAEVDREALAKTDETIKGFSRFGEGVRPSWLEEKKKLLEKGAFFQYGSVDTIEDLVRISEDQLNKQYELYRPPRSVYDIEIPASEYDEGGFDKKIKFDYDFKEGFPIHTFVSTNVVQDFGKVAASPKRANYLTSYDTIFVEFDPDLNIVAGDKFSIYAAQGGVKHKNSDREGLQYTIIGSIEAKRKVDQKWVCEILGRSNDIISRGDRITVYTPNIERIIKTFSSRVVEAIIVDGYDDMKKSFAFGDIVYLDRGRNDGVELGNIFETYGFRDGITREIITQNPSYKTGELTVITLTDNFATALVTMSRDEIPPGALAITKSKALAALATKKQNGQAMSGLEEIKLKGLQSLDSELNLENMDSALLDKAGSIDFTDEEIEELERQERENSFLENEKDLSDIEDLESDLQTAQEMIDAAKMDEDKLLQQQNLESVEADLATDLPESLEEFEDREGKKYIDEELDSRENPYGLTEFDIEEVDELLNVEQIEASQSQQLQQLEQTDPVSSDGGLGADESGPLDELEDVSLDELDSLDDIQEIDLDN